MVISYSSMMSMFIFETLDFIAREIRKKTEPFGGIQLVLLGDVNGFAPSISQTCCCPHCGHNLRVIGTSAINVPPEALVPGGVIACVNNSCQRLFHNTWILYAFESSSWDAHRMHYFQLEKSRSADEQLSTLISELNESSLTETAQKLVEKCKKPFQNEALQVTHINVSQSGLLKLWRKLRL
jgi:PIF1-like helicase